MSMFMNIFGAVVFGSIGILIIALVPKALMYKEGIDFSGYRIAEATVLHTGGCGHDGGAQSWMVSFCDDQGNEVLGMDYLIAYSTFSPHKYHLPQNKTKQKIYYWDYTRRSTYSINGEPVRYYIHFCDESLYEINRIEGKKSARRAVCVGLVFIVAGLILFSKALFA